jgi:hypothetical protein
MPELNEFINAAKNIHSSIAGDVWPDGQMLYCHKCGATIHYTRDECGYYLGHGWPKKLCCGERMKWEPPLP